MYILFCIVLAILACSVVDGLSYPLPQNGWYPCNQDTFANPLNKRNKPLSAQEKLLHDVIRGGKSVLNNVAQPLAAASDVFDLKGTIECSQFTLPLCHTGVCDSNKTIDIFVKRKLASNQNPTPKAVWLLQGGPGASTAGAMETIMGKVYSTLGGSADIYTMDHRGTGRSHRLECTAAQVETSGSPSGGALTPEVLSACIKDVNIQLGPSPNNSILSAFSTTSAAMDISTLVTNSNNTNTYVYGVSYGTYLVERLMQLNNTNIKGYILDGVVSQSGSDENKKLVFNDWDSNMGTVAERFVSLCSSDERCNKNFSLWVNSDLPSGLRSAIDLKNSILKMYASLKGITDATIEDCQIPFRFFAGSAGKTLQNTQTLFGYMLQQQSLRGFIPILVYRFLRCSKDDKTAINNFLVQFNAILSVVDEGDYFKSEMLYLLIVTSELWRFPSESFATLEAASSQALFSSGTSSLLSLVCVASGAKDPNCESLVKPSNDYILQYPRDQYYDKPITIPTQSSVLMLSGLLDPQTVAKYARYQYDSFIGTEKRLFEFNYSAHGTVLHSPRNGDCALGLIASYVRENGKLNNVDISCTSQIDYPFDVPFMFDSMMLGTDLDSADLYEAAPRGSFKQPSMLASLSYDNAFEQTRNYRTAMIIGYVLAGILLIIVIVQCVLRCRQKKKSTPEESPVLTPAAEV